MGNDKARSSKVGTHGRKDSSGPRIVEAREETETARSSKGHSRASCRMAERNEAGTATDATSQGRIRSQVGRSEKGERGLAGGKQKSEQ